MCAEGGAENIGVAVMLSGAEEPLASGKTTCSLLFGVGGPTENGGFAAVALGIKLPSPPASEYDIVLGGVKGDVEDEGPGCPFCRPFGGCGAKFAVSRRVMCSVVGSLVALDFLFFADGPNGLGEGGLDRTRGVGTAEVRWDELPDWIGGGCRALALRFKACISDVDCDCRNGCPGWMAFMSLMPLDAVGAPGAADESAASLATIGLIGFGGGCVL